MSRGKALGVPEAWSGPLASWDAVLIVAGRPATTRHLRRDHLRMLGRALGGCPWDVTGEQLVDWAKDRQWSVETRRSVRSSLRAFYGWAVLAGHVDVNPAEALPPVKPARPRARPASELAYRAALTGADPRERVMVRLAAECGLRRGEIAGVHSRDLVEDLGGWTLVVHGKGARERLVPLPGSLARELRRLGPGYAFPGAVDGHLSPRWVGKLVGRRLPEALSTHTLRHRFATSLHRAGVDVFVIQDLLGHASPETTRRYVQLDESAKRRAVEAIAS